MPRPSWADFTRLYVSDDGATGPDPWDLVARPTIVLARLARFLSPVAIRRDYAPCSPWQGCERIEPVAPAPPPAATDPDEIGERFAAAVREVVGGAGVIAVALSGGMDSVAITAAVDRLCARDGRELVALTIDDDDDGRSSAVRARQVLAALGARCRHIVIDPRDAVSEPRWDPCGPSFDTEPGPHRRLADAAQDAGAQLILNGGGADQLLRAPEHLTLDLWRARRTRDALRFVRERPAGDASRLADALPVLATAMSRRASAALYTSRFESAYRSCAGTAMLMPVYAERVDAWLAAFTRERVLSHARHGWSWARAFLADMVFPHDPIVAAGELPERSPFLTRAFADYAWALPADRRYSPHRPTPYVREKELVARLLPAAVRPVVPRHRSLATRAFAEYWSTHGSDAPRLVEAGVLRPDWRSRARSTFDVQMVSSCERWLGEALARGAEITDD